MLIGSHNSFSYSRIRQWWLRPFAFVAKCQNVDVVEQMKFGVTMFDLRVRFDDTGKLIVCHGLVEYDIEWIKLFDFFRLLDEEKDKKYYVRVALETSEPDSFQEEHFSTFCRFIETSFPNINFFGGNNRTDWYCEHPIYKFKHPLEDMDNLYASATTLFPGKKRWLRFIDDIYPRFYAKRFNKKNIEKGTSHKWMVLDFINIR